jgi:Flp pilus assembly protein TadG
MRVSVRGLGVRDEDGATLAIVVVSLVVILGMAALAIDFGTSYVTRRSMVNAADAAALAFAESCALGPAGSQDAQADDLARANTSDAIRKAGSPANWPVTGACAPGSTANKGSVTVHYQGQAPQSFAAILGRSSSQTVVANSSAAWGAANGAGGVLPVMLNEGRLTTCNLPGPVPNTECWWYIDSSVLQTAQWALMNVDPTCSDGKYGWNVTTACSKVSNPNPTYNCPQFSDQDLQNIIQNGSPELKINYPQPTYACVTANGNRQNVFAAIDALKGQTRLFPVNDETKQIKQGGVLCPAPCSSGLAFYDIVGFIQLKILNVWRGNNPNWDSVNCPGIKNANAYCFHAIWLGFTINSGGGICDQCQNFGVETVELKG